MKIEIEQIDTEPSVAKFKRFNDVYGNVLIMRGWA